MLFNSLEFAVFLPVVFLFYWFFFQNNLSLQNLLLLVASYVFYGWWDWRFLSLIILSSFLDYNVGLFLARTSNTTKRKVLLWTSMLFNLGLLGVFKYFNFFAENFAILLTNIGFHPDPFTIQILLPVGISFYTFQTMSYTIDVYRGKLHPTRDIIAFFAFVSFFPQLVAGPIERATNLLPQFYKKRFFNKARSIDGLRQILWGLFKKMVIADNCSTIVNDIFTNYEEQNGLTLAIGAVLFAFQIYGDFSGYSDIAIGTSRLFGFNLMQNFAFPYFSRDIAEFWRRWHISLSTWFRDYLYIPLGGSRGHITQKVRNTFLIFIVSGFWHGANWTFIVWGLLNALYFIPLLLAKRNRLNTDVVAANSNLPNIREVGQVMFTFAITCFAWIFFRATNLEMSVNYIRLMFVRLFDSTTIYPLGLLPCFIIILVAVEWMQRREQHGLDLTRFKASRTIKWLCYLIVTILILTFNGNQQDFIYFQF